MPARSYAWPQGHWDWYQHLAFKHGVRAGEMAFVGGQVDKSSTGEPLHAFDLATQTAVVIRHIDTVLREFGAGLANVVKLVAFYATDGSVDETAFLADIGRHILAHGGAPDGVGPAITLVPLPCLALPGMMVEIEAIAMLGRTGNGSENDRQPTSSSTATSAIQPWRALWRAHLDVCPGESDGGRQHAVSPGSRSADGCRYGACSSGSHRAGCGSRRHRQAGYVVPGRRHACHVGTSGAHASGYFTVPGPTVSALPTPSLPHGDMTRVDAWAMRGVDGRRLARAYTQLHDAWQWPVALPATIGLQCGEFVFVGQQVALDAQGQPIAPGQLLEQTRRVMESTRTVLASFGLTLDDMVKQNSFYQGQADPETIVTNQRYRSSFYSEPAGASTGVPLPCLPLEDLLVSVETVAMTRS